MAIPSGRCHAVFERVADAHGRHQGLRIAVPGSLGWDEQQVEVTLWSVVRNYQ